MGVWGKRRGRREGGRKEKGGEGWLPDPSPPFPSKGSVALLGPPRAGLRDKGSIFPPHLYPSAF